MAKYRVMGLVTISVSIEVDASSPAEARRIAEEAPMQTLCNGCADGDPEAWSTSGELDGEPKIETVTRLDSKRSRR